MARQRHLFVAVLLAAAALLVVLVTTGVWLHQSYRPDGLQAVRIIHRLASQALIGVFLTALIVAFLRRRERTLSSMALVSVVVASFTGFLLPWDQLALWAVTVSEDLGGFRSLYDDRLRFAIIGGVEVAPATLLCWLAVHVGVAAAAIACTVAGLARLRTTPR